MLDHQVIDLTNQFIEVEFKKRRQGLTEGALAIAQRLSARGHLHSGAHVLEVIKLCEAEISARASFVVRVHADVLTQLNIQPYPSLANELKERLRCFLPLQDDYISVADSLETRIGLQRPINARVQLASTREQAIKLQDAQIDLTVLSSLRKVESGTAQSTSITYIINAPIGAFQAGAGSTATVNQTFSVGDREALLKALELVQNAIQHENKISTFDKGEVIELIDDGKAEVEKSKPNRTKLASIMNTVSSAIKTVETLQSVYQTLKNAAAPFGIPLP